MGVHVHIVKLFVPRILVDLWYISYTFTFFTQWRWAQLSCTHPVDRLTGTLVSLEGVGAREFRRVYRWLSQFAREDSLGSFLVVGGRLPPGFQGGDDGIKTERYQGRMADKLERLVYEWKNMHDLGVSALLIDLKNLFPSDACMMYCNFLHHSGHFGWQCICIRIYQLDPIVFFTVDLHPFHNGLGVLLGSEDLEKRQCDGLVMDHWGVVFGLGPFRWNYKVGP